MNLGERLFELRKSKQLSQEEVADRINVTRQTVSKWETNQSTPDFDKIIPLCELYGLTADELITGKKQDIQEISIVNMSEDEDKIKNKRAKGISISILLYFISVVWLMVSIPVFFMNPILSSAIFILIIGIATCNIVYTCTVYKKNERKEKDGEQNHLKKIHKILSLVVLIIYLFISFKTMAWHITWLIWIVYALVYEVIKLIISLKEAGNEEK